MLASNWSLGHRIWDYFTTIVIFKIPVITATPKHDNSLCERPAFKGSVVS